MGAALWSESIRETEEVFLVDSVQDSDGRPLDDLVLKGGYHECALPTVRFGYVNAPGWQRSIGSLMNPRVQVRDVAVKLLLVGSPRQTVHSRRSILFKLKERRLEVLRTDVV
jgi:hypothetical protein